MSGKQYLDELLSNLNAFAGISQDRIPAIVEYVAEIERAAALSVPAAAVVGEPGPIGYCSEYGLDKLASQAHNYCLSVSKAPENEFQFPIYASRISHRDAELDRMRRELAAERESVADLAAETTRLTDAMIASRLAASEAREQLAEARKVAFIEAAEIAETLGVYPELNIFAGGPEWYKHGKAIAAALRAKAEEAKP